jgi:hypothetical protein
MWAEVQIAHVITGIIGGLIRGLVGITKQSTFTPDKFQFQWKYFGFSMLVSAIVGLMSGIIIDNDWRMSLLAGYAGTDFLEGLYRLKFAQFFKLPETTITK